MEIERKYVVDDKNHKVAVQLDIEAFEKIEEVLENYGLVQLMSDAASRNSENLYVHIANPLKWLQEEIYRD